MLKVVSSMLKAINSLDPFAGVFCSSFDWDFNKSSDELFDWYVGSDSLPKLVCNQDKLKALVAARNFRACQEPLNHLVSHMLQDISGIEEMLDRELANVALDLANPNCKAYQSFAEEHNIPKNKISRWYYQHLEDPDFVDPSIPDDRSMRQLDPTLAFNIDKMASEGIDWAEALGVDINDHMLWDWAQTLSRDLIPIILEQIEGIAEIAAKGTGRCPAGYEYLLVGKVQEAKLDWKRVLRNYLGTALSDMHRVSRRKESYRIEDGMGHRHERKGELMVYVDTSGSMGRKEFEELFSEINKVYKNGYKVTIAECDTEITRKYEYEGGIPETIFGGGGTMFSAVVDDWNKYHRNYTAALFFTDGYDNVQDLNPASNFLWIITSHGYQEDVYPGRHLFIPKDNE